MVFLIPGGFGKRGSPKAKLTAINVCQELTLIPFLGICFGMQTGSVVEAA